MSDLSLQINVSTDDSNIEELEAATLHIRDELLNLDLDSVAFGQQGAPPEGAKAGPDVVIIGTLLLIMPDASLLSSIVDVIRGWTERATRRNARLEIDGDVLEVSGISNSEQKNLIAQWLARHSDSAA